MISILSSQLPTVINRLQGAKTAVFDIENQIPFVETRVRVDIPSPSQIIAVIPVGDNINISPDEIDNINDNFSELKKACLAIEELLKLMISQIDTILGQINRIESIFSSLEGFLNFITDFIPIIRTIIGAAQVGLAAQVGPFVSGVITVRLGDAIKFAKSKVKEIDALAKVTNQIRASVTKETSEIRNKLLPVRRRLNEILITITARRLLIDTIYTDLLKKVIEVSMTQNPPSEGGTDGPQGTGVIQNNDQIIDALASQFGVENILDNLENSSKQQFIEYLVENGYTGYQIVKR